MWGGGAGAGGQTECIIGDAKVVNSHPPALEIENDVNFLKRCFWSRGHIESRCKGEFRSLKSLKITCLLSQRQDMVMMRL